MEQLQTRPPQIISVKPIMPQLENPSHWMRDGESPAEIILALAFLISAIAGLMKVWFDSKR